MDRDYSSGDECSSTHSFIHSNLKYLVWMLHPKIAWIKFYLKNKFGIQWPTNCSQMILSKLSKCFRRVQEQDCRQGKEGGL